MSYNNQNNPYGMKPLNEKKTMREVTENTLINKVPVKSVEESYMQSSPSINQSCAVDCECENNCSCGNNCDCQQQSNTCTPCNNQNNFVDSCNTCQSPLLNCCNGDPCVYDKNKETCFASYMNVIYSEGKTSGTNLFSTVTLSAPNYSIIPTYTQINGCCTSCGVDATSVFTIDSTKTTVKGFVLSSSIPTTSIVVNGQNPLQVTQVGNNYEAVIDPSVLNELCSCNNLGSKANILMKDLGPWSCSAQYELCGTVVTQGNSCRFRIVVQNLSTLPDTVNQPVNIMVSDVCMPNSQMDPILMNLQFDADASLINPTITAIGGPSPLPTTLTIGGTLMLNIGSDVNIAQRKKVYFKGIIEN